VKQLSAYDTRGSPPGQWVKAGDLRTKPKNKQISQDTNKRIINYPPAYSVQIMGDFLWEIRISILKIITATV